MICWRSKCLRVTADLSLSHKALIIHSWATRLSRSEETELGVLLPSGKEEENYQSPQKVWEVQGLCWRAEHPGSCWSPARWGRARGRAPVERMPAGDYNGDVAEISCTFGS